MTINIQQAATDSQSQERRIYINLQPPPNYNCHFKSNAVRRSKYTLLNFIPKNIYEQFLKNIANFYFLVLVILQLLPAFKEVGILITTLPVILVLSTSGLKDGIEDWKRHRLDQKVNEQRALIKRQNCGQTHSSVEHQDEPKETSPTDGWDSCKWCDIQVGDFILLLNNDQVPADLVIISTGEPNSICYTETKNLDGETNLKIRRGISDLSRIKSASDCMLLNGFIDAEWPNPNLYTFNATLTIDSTKDAPTVYPISVGGSLLRGSTIRNTCWVIGLAVYTGSDSKMILNYGDLPMKQSRIDRQLNIHILLNIVILLALCGVCGFIGMIYVRSFGFDKSEFTISAFLPEDPILVGTIVFFNCMIIFQNIIPISLLLSAYFVKTVQSFFIYCDSGMYDEATDSTALPRSWNLCDDLGQIEYIFSDKTGTLTCNSMEFKNCTINGRLYGLPRSADLDTQHHTREQMYKKLEQCFGIKNFGNNNDSFADLDFPDHLEMKNFQSKRIREFFTLLAVCHTVFIDENQVDGEISYKAQSPDEAALVKAARQLGFTYLNRTENTVEIDILGTRRAYTILNILEFTSERKRMSVILRRPEGEIVLLCKGADCVLFERLESDSASLKYQTSEHLKQFANQGLRTLCLAYRIISEEEYNNWNSMYLKAQHCLVNRELELENVSDVIERKMVLMGATGIEDKLQSGVPESIKVLKEAGIKLWVLTGDKVETAVNIGFSCNLLTKSTILIQIQAFTKEDTFKQLVNALNQFWEKNGRPVNGQNTALVCDGNTLKIALDEEIKPLLLEIACRCSVVLFCRVSPLQKALVVRMVKNGLGAMCLAIGDGANDVSMIQEADIGIGIQGKEGLHAAMASDYSISQFRFITRLLLIHGRWAYLRTAEMVLNYFYKNVYWLLILFFQQFYCGFSACLSMDFTYSMFLNTLFTSFTTVAVGFLDKDVNASISLLFPAIYKGGINQTLYSNAKFWQYFLEALYHAAVCFFGARFILGEVAVDNGGNPADQATYGNLLAWTACTTINIFSTINWHTWNALTIISFLICQGSWVLYVFMYSNDVSSPAFGINFTAHQSIQFYLGIALLVVVSILPRIVYKYVQQQLYPTDIDILKEIQQTYWRRNLRISDSSIVLKSDTGETQLSAESEATEILKDASEIEQGIDGFIQSKRKSSIRSSTFDAISRRPSTDGCSNHSATSSAISSAIASSVHRASQLFRSWKFGRSSQTLRRLHGGFFHMGSMTEVSNTGYAFSQDAGIADLIVPEVTDISSRTSSNVRNQLQSITRSIQSVFRGNRNGPPLLHPLTRSDQPPRQAQRKRAERR